MNGGVPGGGGFEGAPPPSSPEKLPQHPQAPKVEKPVIGQQEQNIARTINQEIRAGVDPDIITKKVAIGNDGIPAAEKLPTDTLPNMVVQPEGFTPPNSEIPEATARLDQLRNQQPQQNPEQQPTDQPQREVSTADSLTTWEHKVANKNSLTLDETRELIKAKNDPNLDPEQRKRMQKVFDKQFTLSWNELAKQVNEAQRNNPLFSQFPPEQQAKLMQEFNKRMDVIMRKVANGEELTDEERKLYQNAETLLMGASAEVTTRAR